MDLAQKKQWLVNGKTDQCMETALWRVRFFTKKLGLRCVTFCDLQLEVRNVFFNEVVRIHNQKTKFPFAKMAKLEFLIVVITKALITPNIFSLSRECPLIEAWGFEGVIESVGLKVEPRLGWLMRLLEGGEIWCYFRANKVWSKRVMICISWFSEMCWKSWTSLCNVGKGNPTISLVSVLSCDLYYLIEEVWHNLRNAPLGSSYNYGLNQTSKTWKKAAHFANRLLTCIHWNH